MRPLSVQLKYGPWRDRFIVRWRDRARKVVAFRRSGEVSKGVRAKLLLDALCDTCYDMDGVDDDDWVASLGKSISHASGPLATLHRLGILKKTGLKRGQALHLGKKQKQLRRVCSGVRERAAAKAKLLRWVELSQSLPETIAPRTCQNWVEEHARLDKLFQKQRLFPRKSYMRNFVIRGLLLAGMARAGIQKLRGIDELSVLEFAAAFPDQGCWFTKLGEYSNNESRTVNLGDFLRSLDYDGRPEFFSMFACVLLCKCMRVSPAWLALHARELTDAMLMQLGRRGFCRLPALCVRECK